MPSKKTIVLVLIILSAFWSSGGVAAKALLTTFDPISVGAIRLTLAAFFILPLFFRFTPKITKKLIADIVPISLLATGNFLLFLFGIKYTTANASAIIYTATPITVALLSNMLIGERVSRQKIGGILVGLLGVCAILVLPLFDNGAHIGDIRGNVLIFFAMISFALLNIGTRHLITVKNYHPITITTVGIVISALCFDLLLLVAPRHGNFSLLLTPATLGAALYIAIFVTVIPYVLHQWVIRHSSAATGSLTTYIQPFFGFILNSVFLGEIITPLFLVGAILVFAGVVVVTGESTKKIIRHLANSS